MDPRLHRILLLFGLLCVLLPLPFIWLHIATPSDGARLTREPVIFTEHGIIVAPYAIGSSLLREGDIVTAVDGIPVETLVRELVGAGPARPRWQAGETVRYTLLRDGVLQDVAIPLGALPLRAILRDHWSVILFILVSQVVAGLVYLQRREDPAARAFFIWAFSGSHTYTWAFYLQISDFIDPVGFWLFHLAATGLWLVFWAAVVHMTLVFPKPLIPFHHRTKWVFLLYSSSFLVFTAYLVWQWRNTPNLLLWWDHWGTGQSLVAALYTLPGLVFITLQYRTSRSEIEHIKTRWVIFGTLVSLGLGLVFYFIPALIGRSSISANALGLINFPTYQLIVIGGGPAGSTAALRARELGRPWPWSSAARWAAPAPTTAACRPGAGPRRPADGQRQPVRRLRHGRAAAGAGLSAPAGPHPGHRLRDPREEAAHRPPGGCGRGGLCRRGRGALSWTRTPWPCPTAAVARDTLHPGAGGRARRLDFPGEELALTHSDIWRLQKLPARWSSSAARPPAASSPPSSTPSAAR
jgi:hypothetical protein